jgi:dihydropteroate synthase
LQNGIDKSKIIIDPGIGFGKNVNDNLELMKRVKELKSFKVPVLLAVSRKSTIGKVLGDLVPEDRLEGTIATSVMAVEAGVNIVRVHDVKENSRAIRMMEAIKNCI